MGSRRHSAAGRVSCVAGDAIAGEKSTGTEIARMRSWVDGESCRTGGAAAKEGLWHTVLGAEACKIGAASNAPTEALAAGNCKRCNVDMSHVAFAGSQYRGLVWSRKEDKIT